MGRLFWKIFAFVMLAQLVATLAIGGAFWLKEQSSTPTPSVDAGPPSAVTVNAVEVLFRHGGTVAVRELIGSMDAHHQLYLVDDEDRELLGRPIAPGLLADARRRAAQPQERPVVRELMSPDGHRYLAFQAHDDKPRMKEHGKPLMLGPQLPGVHPAKSESHHEPYRQFGGVIAAVLVSLVFAGLLAWYFAKPIKVLRTALTDAGSGNLRTKAGPLMGSRRDELADLGRVFDGMAGRLDALMEGQRNLLHDVSHELRSPLARMQLAIGLARQQPERVMPALERIEREGARMDRLIGELLTLSRLEAGVALPQAEEVDIDEMLATIIDDAKFEAQQKSVMVRRHGDGKAVVLAQPELLARAVENIVRNAIKFTREASEVTVDTQVDGRTRQLTIAVQDQGPGVAATMLADMFQPFFRGDDTAKSADGHGLGLAIAQRVILKHGGAISAANRPEGGLCVRIVLPCLAQDAQRA